MDILLFLLLLLPLFLAMVFSLQLVRTLRRNTFIEPPPKEDPPQKLNAVERANYYKSRTDLPVETAGVYEGEDEENIAAVVRAAFLTGGMVVGNVNDDGELELTVHDPKD